MVERRRSVLPPPVCSDFACVHQRAKEYPGYSYVLLVSADSLHCASTGARIGQNFRGQHDSCGRLWREGWQQHRGGGAGHPDGLFHKHPHRWAASQPHEEPLPGQEQAGGGRCYPHAWRQRPLIRLSALLQALQWFFQDSFSITVENSIQHCQIFQYF